MRGAFPQGDTRITQVPVSNANGTTVLAAAQAGKSHRVVGVLLTIDAVGTVKFRDSTPADLSGAMAISATGGFVASPVGGPWWQAAPNTDLQLVTTQPVNGTVWVLTTP